MYDDDLRQLALFDSGPSAGESMSAGGPWQRDGPLMLPSATIEWGSPHDLVQEYADRWADGAFDLDVAASPELHVCSDYLTQADDGLARPWHGRCWMNPPYGRPEEAWVAKAVREVAAGRADLVAALMPAKTGKGWWQRYVQAERSESGVLRLRWPVRAVDFLRGRVRYLRPDGTQAEVAGFSSVMLLFQAWSPARVRRQRAAARGQLSIPGV